jgi:hypothetical protein
VRIKGPQTTPNSPPTVASPIADVGPLLAGGDTTVDLSGVFTDADGDRLTLEVVSSDDDVSVGLIQYISGAELWVLAGVRGTAELTVTANDEKGGIVSDTFTVTVKEAPTVASPIADISSLKAGASKQISLSGVFADADGDALTLGVASSNSAVVTVSTQIDGTTQAVSGLTVVGVAEGTATITVTAEDTDGNRVIDTFDVTVPAAQQQQKHKREPQLEQQGGGSDDQGDGPKDDSADGEEPLPEEYTPPEDEPAAQQQVVLLPGAVGDLILTATDGGVRVSWTAPAVGGAPARYIAHLKPEGGETGSGKTKRPKAKKTQVTFDNLDPGTTYEVWVRAQNALGKGERVHATITLPGPQPE